MRIAPIIIVTIMLLSQNAGASSFGVFGYSGQNVEYCTLCHMGGTEPIVTLTGPRTLAVGTTAVYTLTIEGGQNTAGGFDVAVDAGVLSVHPTEVMNTGLRVGDLTHTRPKMGSPTITWTFNWTAPQQAQVVTMYGAGNSVDLDMTTMGDMAATDALMIEVEACPDADMDGFKRADCNPIVVKGGGDCNDNNPQVWPGREETCGDGLDNNCVLGVDEGCEPCTIGETRSCFSGPPALEGIGACQPGVETCEGPFWTGACVGDTLPSDEVCNNVDDDCDGDTDGIVEVCYSGPVATEDVGLCRGGQRLCEAGNWSLCSGEVIPVEEACNAQDDNCDGEIDEVCICEEGEVRPCYSGPVGTANRGICHIGFERCLDGIVWSECEGQRVPGTEICEDGIDQDCDGVDLACPLDFGCLESSVVPLGPKATDPKWPLPFVALMLLLLLRRRVRSFER